VKEGILSVDRYAAYQAMKQVKEGLILFAFCWAHVRRDFLEAAPDLHPVRKSVLTSLQEHWDGRTVFVEHPEVPLDNNTAERIQRGPVALRQNSYGSGATWAGELAAMLFSVLQALCWWNINPRAWRTAYLQACAEGGGKAAPRLADFLPWKMSEPKRKEWSLDNGKEAEDSSCKATKHGQAPNRPPWLSVRGHLDPFSPLREASKALLAASLHPAHGLDNPILLAQVRRCS
jgi:transposase